MGIDAGILVKEQITDEVAWKRAMQDVEFLLQGNEYFKRHIPRRFIPSFFYKRDLPCHLSPCRSAWVS